LVKQLLVQPVYNTLRSSERCPTNAQGRCKQLFIVLNKLPDMFQLPNAINRRLQQPYKSYSIVLVQRCSNFFQGGTTFISQNVLRTALLLSPLKANCLRFSTTVCDTQFKLILFFSVFFWTNVQSKRTKRAEPEDHLWSADHSLGNADVEDYDTIK
jgi:hypothetical protein